MFYLGKIMYNYFLYISKKSILYFIRTNDLKYYNIH